MIDVVSAGGEERRLAYEWPIDDAASVLRSRQPGVIHLIALLAIAGAIGLLVYPALRKGMRALNLSATSTLLALVAIAVSLGVIVFGAVLIGDQQRSYELTLNPPPQVINTVLPDAESLTRGERLYSENCLVWQGQSADFRALRNRLDIARDDFLYQAVTEGWRDLPRCGC